MRFCVLGMGIRLSVLGMGMRLSVLGMSFSVMGMRLYKIKTKVRTIT